ncbi:MAG: HRDC domain-containing protein [Pirellula sp.]
MNEHFSYITNLDSLHQLCDKIKERQLVAFDTEFVAEDSYRPELCLVQVAVDDDIAIIDPYLCGDLGCFWESLVDANVTVIVHAGREETLFCYRATKRLMHKLFDIQIAAAFLGFEYPASYGNLVHRFTGAILDKEETRSDWRVRPLTTQQLQYAAQDVRDLPRLYKTLTNQLGKLDRIGWLEEETRRWQEELGEYESSENWYRISGIQSLSGNSLSIVRGLWSWRETKAKERDIPPRKILRDDLMIELARRGTSDARRISSLRGMEHRHMKQHLPELTKAIEESLNQPPPIWPRRQRYGKGQPPAMVTQFLSAALAYICRTKKISPAIVATSDDLRDFVKYRLDPNGDVNSPPSLLVGWRAEIVGKQLDQLLSGELAMVLDDLESETPIRFCRAEKAL